MITGFVTSSREAVIRLQVRGAGGHEETIDAVVDTGFNGFLTLPTRLASDLALSFAGTTRAALGDGTEVQLDVFETVVVWDGRERWVVALATGGGALVGMSMLSECRVTLDVLEGGAVTIAAVPPTELPPT